MSGNGILHTSFHRVFRVDIFCYFVVSILGASVYLCLCEKKRDLKKKKQEVVSFEKKIFFVVERSQEIYAVEYR